MGPPVDFKEEEIKKASGDGAKLLDFDKVKLAEVPLLALSGGVKVVGEASKVSFGSSLHLFLCSGMLEVCSTQYCDILGAQLFFLHNEDLSGIHRGAGLICGTIPCAYCSGYIIVKFIHFKVFPDFP